MYLCLCSGGWRSRCAPAPRSAPRSTRTGRPSSPAASTGSRGAARTPPRERQVRTEDSILHKGGVIYSTFSNFRNWAHWNWLLKWKKIWKFANTFLLLNKKQLQKENSKFKNVKNVLSHNGKLVLTWSKENYFFTFSSLLVIINPKKTSPLALPKQCL